MWKWNFWRKRWAEFIHSSSFSLAREIVIQSTLDEFVFYFEETKFNSFMVILRYFASRRTSELWEIENVNSRGGKANICQNRKRQTRANERIIHKIDEILISQLMVRAQSQLTYFLASFSVAESLASKNRPACNSWVLFVHKRKR